MQAEHPVFCANTCADAIQMKTHRLKIFILYSEKVHRIKDGSYTLDTSSEK